MIKIKNKLGKIFILISLMIVFVASASAFEYYAGQKLLFDGETITDEVNSLKISTYACANIECSEVKGIKDEFVTYYNGDSVNECVYDYLYPNKPANPEFYQCLENNKINGDIIDLNDEKNIYRNGNEQVSTFLIGFKENYDSNLGDYPNKEFGYVTYIFTENDEYIVSYKQKKFDYINSIEYTNGGYSELPLNNKFGGFAEIGNFNILNTNDSSKPIQVDVSTEMNSEICSAFQFTNPNLYKPELTLGYSDYSVDTKLTLKVYEKNNPDNSYEQSKVFTVKAGDCEKSVIDSFSWIPKLEDWNKEFIFNLSTEIIDNQFKDTEIKSESKSRVIYPETLENTCWTIVEDFTLSNKNSFDIDSQVTEIKIGETLFALFKSAGYTGDDVEPISYEYKLMFNNEEIQSGIKSNSGNDLEENSIELTNEILNLSEGVYSVILITKGFGSTCSLQNNESIEIKNLNLLELEKYDVKFIVEDSEGNLLENARVNLVLEESRDDIIVSYDEVKFTNSNGEVIFNQVFEGDYNYEVSKSNYVTNSGDLLQVISDREVRIVLDAINVNESYLNFYVDEDYGVENLDVIFTVEFDNFEDDKICKFDFGDGERFETCEGLDGLTHSYLEVGIYNPSLTITDSIRSLSESVNIIVNDIPVIDFVADKISGYGLTEVEFVKNITDVIFTEDKTCQIDFGDGTILDDCLDDKFSHNYIAGIYTAKISYNDGYNEITEKEINISIERDDAPIINLFTVDVSGNELPANLSLKYNVTHPNDLDIDCSIFINNGEYVLDSCIGDLDLIENKYLKLGLNKIMLQSNDSIGNIVNKTIEIRFGYEHFELDVDKNLYLGEFDFDIIVNNEIFEREFSLTPIITCNGEEFTFGDNGGVLYDKLNTKVSEKSEIYNFKVDSNDFSKFIPEDTLCEFKVILSNLNNENSYILFKNIEFKFNFNPYTLDKIPSVTGRDGEVRNFKRNIFNVLEKGYNLVTFNVANNDNIEKRFSVNVIGSTLGIQHQRNFLIDSEEVKDIEMMIYINEDTPKGMHPVRYTVNTGEDKITRYGYVNIK